MREISASAPGKKACCCAFIRLLEDLGREKAMALSLLKKTR
jgi:hypothetical protein